MKPFVVVVLACVLLAAIEARNHLHKRAKHIKTREPDLEARTSLEKLFEREQLNVETRQPKPEERSVEVIAEREESNVEARELKPEERSVEVVAEREESNFEARQPRPEERSVEVIAEREESNVEARELKPEERSVEVVAEREESNFEARQPRPEERSVEVIAEREESNVEARELKPEERSVDNVVEREKSNVEARQPKVEESSMFDDINERREAQMINVKRDDPVIRDADLMNVEREDPMAVERSFEEALFERRFGLDKRSRELEDMFERAEPLPVLRREPLDDRRSYIPEAVFQRNLYPSMREREYLYERRNPTAYRRREFPPVEKRTAEQNAERHLMPM